MNKQRQPARDSLAPIGPIGGEGQGEGATGEREDYAADAACGLSSAKIITPAPV